jgi:inositol phosphorylceramide mannosyltransferase catalytic subunit
VIPRIIHQVWVGPEPLPERFGAYQETWRAHHPDWDIRFWTEDNLPPDLRLSQSYDRMRSPVERCDLLRLELVWRDGGVYVDCDFESRRPLDPLLEEVDFLLGYSKPGRVNHALMGAVPRHPLLDRALREIRPRETYGYDKDATGPGFFNRLVAEHKGLRILDPVLFYPRTPEERRRAYAVHHEARSWKAPPMLLADLERAENRLGYARDELRALQARYQAALAENEAPRERLGGNLLAGVRACVHRLRRTAVPRDTTTRLRRRLARLRRHAG